jgi:hypothetical protein
MNSREVRIERLVLRLRGVAPEAARRAADDLGREILQRLAQQERVAGGRGRVEIDVLDLGPVTAPAEGTPTHLRAAVAGAIVEGIAAQLPATHGG